MRISSRSAFMLVELLSITLLSAHQAKEAEVLSEVTGYVGKDVILPCKLPGAGNISQVQWFLNPPGGGERISLIVFQNKSNINVPDTPLKDRLEVTFEYLKIRNVQSSDEGLYTCLLSSFPSGSLEGDTDLFVYEQMPLAAGVVAAIVVAVMLLFVIMAAAASLIFIRRCSSPSRHPGTCRPHVRVMTSFRRDEEVVYADVKCKGPRAPTLSPSDAGAVHTDDVTYSQVLHWHLKEDEEMIV